MITDSKGMANFVLTSIVKLSDVGSVNENENDAPTGPPKRATLNDPK
jgi:hypothetical protein